MKTKNSVNVKLIQELVDEFVLPAVSCLILASFLYALIF